jgi:hypothetical protein
VLEVRIARASAVSDARDRAAREGRGAGGHATRGGATGAVPRLERGHGALSHRHVDGHRDPNGEAVERQKGLEELPAVPPSKWRSKAPRDLEAVTEEWSLTVTSKGAYLGNCRFGVKGYDDRDECSHWEYVRVFPGKLVKQAPEFEAPVELPEVKPTRTTTSSFEEEHASILRCTRDGKTVEIPAADSANRSYGVGAPEWISAEPAIFTLVEYSEGDPTTESTAVYVDCESTAYRTAVRGPHGIVALLGDGLAAMEGGPNPTDTVSSIRRDGREIGTVREGHLVFAP